MRPPSVEMRRALIGLSTSEMRDADRTRRLARAEPPMRELALGLTYPRAVDRSGGIPVVIPPMDTPAIEPLLARLDGLVLSGGPDLHPSFYGAKPHPALGPTEPDLDHFELELVRRADALGMPILAICRGLQLLNVARGGTLIQDIPTQVTTEIDHRQEQPGPRATHDIRLAPRSRLEGAMGRTARDANSFHHQAVEILGDGLTAVAWAPDGIIEGIEDPTRDFVVGVQWHAESLAEREDQADLFSAFNAAALRFGGLGRRAAA